MHFSILKILTIILADHGCILCAIIIVVVYCVSFTRLDYMIGLNGAQHVVNQEI